MTNPVKGMVWKLYPEGNITQWFGENPALYAQFGMKGHNGIDIVSPWGTPIYATSSQKVVEVKSSPTGYGKYVRCVDADREYAYGHLSEIQVILGQQLSEGAQIGLMGNTGFVVSGATPYWKYNPYAGTHLHYGERIIASCEDGETCNYYPTGDKAEIVNYNNGFFGAVDPLPRFVIETPEQKIQGLLTVVSLMNQVLSLLKQLRLLKGR